MLEFQTEPSIHSKNYKPNITKYTLWILSNNF
jgi:hypothetical protein